MTSKAAASSKRAVLPRTSDYTKSFLRDWGRLSGSGRFNMKHLKEAIMLLTANDEPLGPEWLDLDPERLPLIEPEARRALADAFGNGRSLLAIKAAFVRALAAGARQKGLPM